MIVTLLPKFIAIASTLGAMAICQPLIAAELPMTIQADTVLGGECVQSNQFKHNDPIVWRARVIDNKTGEAMGPDALESVVVQLPDGTRFPAHFGDHPPQQSTDSFWSISWPVPQDYPTGTFTYKIVATDKTGQTATFEPFKVATSQLTIAAN